MELGEDALRGLNQNGITCGMTVKIVDWLEAIQVDVDDGKSASVLRRTVERNLETLLEVVAVGQVRQGVMTGEMPDPGLVAFAIGQVSERNRGRGLAEVVDRLTR